MLLMYITGETIHIENYVRCVSDGEGTYIEAGATVDERPSMDVESNGNKKSQKNG